MTLMVWYWVSICKNTVEHLLMGPTLHNGHLITMATFFCPGGQSILWLLFKPLYNGHFRLCPRWPLWRWMTRDAVESSQKMTSKLFRCFLGFNFQWRNVRIHTTNGPSLWRQKNSPTSRGSFAWSIVLLRKLHGGHRCYCKMDLHRRIGGMLTLHESFM